MGYVSEGYATQLVKLTRQDGKGCRNEGFLKIVLR